MATIDVALSGMTVSVALVQKVLPQVAAAFKPFGITLKFVAGTSFGSVDPVQAATFGTLTKQLLANSAQNVPPSPAHLVATQTPPGYTYSLNGSMLDYMRGIAAVYTNASIYGPGGAASRLDILAQICIHELGHMLDLTHGDASGAYPNAMLPSSQRMIPSSPGPAWTAAAAEAHFYGEPAVPQPNPTNFYPFNAQCRSNLRAASNNSA